MKEIKLVYLKLKNFKKLKELVLEPDGEDMVIAGRNEAGKTTIATAWRWLLFNKDVNDNSPQKFEIKPLQEDNEPIHGLDSSVEAKLLINGEPLTLKKVYYEVWEKSRSSTDKVLKTHSTDHYIDEVPAKKNEYDSRISEIIDEKIFRLITDPLYFNMKLHWTERREILLDLVGGIEHEKVVDKVGFDLGGILEKRSAEDHMTVLKEKIKELNNDKEKIPTRIDEVYSGLPEGLNDVSKVQVEGKLEDLQAERESLQKEFYNLEDSGVGPLKEEAAEIKDQLQDIKRDHKEKIDELLRENQNKRADIATEIRNVESLIHHKHAEIKRSKNLIETYQTRIDKLKDEWFEKQEEIRELQDREFDPEKECFACGQELPEEQIEKAEEEFNRTKSEGLEKMGKELEGINVTGSDLQNEKDKLKDSIDGYLEEIEGLEEKKAKLEEKLDPLMEEKYDLKEKYDQYEESEEYKELQERLAKIKNQIDNKREEKAEILKEKKAELAKYDKRIEELGQMVNDLNAYEKSMERVDELKEKERKISAKIEELEEEVYQCEEYIQARAELLEKEVNDKFDLADFKLFEVQMNGAVNPVCETLYNGVPYTTDLNSGHRIQVGIDIINSLSEGFGVRAPVFIDNYETLTEPLDCDSQVIALEARKDWEGLSEIKFDSGGEEIEAIPLRNSSF